MKIFNRIIAVVLALSGVMASAFSFLYRVLYQNVPVAVAKADMNAVWQPDKTWRELIFTILKENGKSPLCDDCNWEN